MKMFTSEQAQQCLAGKRIFFAGDSYQMQFFIGLAGKEVAMTLLSGYLLCTHGHCRHNHECWYNCAAGIFSCLSCIGKCAHVEDDTLTRAARKHRSLAQRGERQPRA